MQAGGAYYIYIVCVRVCVCVRADLVGDVEGGAAGLVGEHVAGVVGDGGHEAGGVQGDDVLLPHLLAVCRVGFAPCRAAVVLVMACRVRGGDDN